jgi:hypothetical protein
MEDLEQILRILRLYFKQLDNNVLSLFSPNGGRFLSSPYGAFSSTQTQVPAAINTPQRVTINTTDYANDTYFVAGDGIHVTRSGIYNVQFSVQATNADVQDHDFAIWLRRGTGSGVATDIPYSSSVATVPSLHGGNPGYLVVAANFFVDLVANDYIEFWWSANSVQVSLNTLPPITTPFVNPGAPSVVVTLSFVSALPT